MGLSKETADGSKDLMTPDFGFPQGFPVCEIDFYADGEHRYGRFRKKGGDRRRRYGIYAAEPVDVPKHDPDDERRNWFWPHRHPAEYDSNCTKTGPRKIVRNNEPADNNPVYTPAVPYLSTRRE